MLLRQLPQAFGMIHAPQIDAMRFRLLKAHPVRALAGAARVNAVLNITRAMSTSFHGA
jgi:hypothetical protein